MNTQEVQRRLDRISAEMARRGIIGTATLVVESGTIPRLYIRYPSPDESRDPYDIAGKRYEWFDAPTHLEQFRKADEFVAALAQPHKEEE